MYTYENFFFIYIYLSARWCQCLQSGLESAKLEADHVLWSWWLLVILFVIYGTTFSNHMLDVFLLNSHVISLIFHELPLGLHIFCYHFVFCCAIIWKTVFLFPLWKWSTSGRCRMVLMSCCSMIHQVDGKLVHKYKHPAPVYGGDWSPFSKWV